MAGERDQYTNKEPVVFDPMTWNYTEKPNDLHTPMTVQDQYLKLDHLMNKLLKRPPHNFLPSNRTRTLSLADDFFVDKTDSIV